MSAYFAIGDHVRERPAAGKYLLRYGVVQGQSPTGRVRVRWRGYINTETGGRNTETGWPGRLTCVGAGTLERDEEARP